MAGDWLGVSPGSATDEGLCVYDHLFVESGQEDGVPSLVCVTVSLWILECVGLFRDGL